MRVLTVIRSSAAHCALLVAGPVFAIGVCTRWHYQAKVAGVADTQSLCSKSWKPNATAHDLCKDARCCCKHGLRPILSHAPVVAGLPALQHLP